MLKPGDVGGLIVQNPRVPTSWRWAVSFGLCSHVWPCAVDPLPLPWFEHSWIVFACSWPPAIFLGQSVNLRVETKRPTKALSPQHLGSQHHRTKPSALQVGLDAMAQAMKGMKVIKNMKVGARWNWVWVVMEIAVHGSPAQTNIRK